MHASKTRKKIVPAVACDIPEVTIDEIIYLLQNGEHQNGQGEDGIRKDKL